MPIAAQAMPPSRLHPHLYEINTWTWLENLSARAGHRITLGSIPEEEWDRFKAAGFDFVWLMGVWKRSALGRRIMRTDPAQFASYDEALPGWVMRDVVGSPYSIQDYTPDPRIGNWDDLDAARRKLNARDIRLIVDFVPNHTGLDHPWVSTHPEYYIQGSLDEFKRQPSAYFLSTVPASQDDPVFIARGKDPFYLPWPDTAQLNYFHDPTCDAMRGVLGTIAAHADGVRCDMSMLVLNDVFARTWQSQIGSIPRRHDEFWSSAIAALPGFIFLGEVYWDMEWRLQQLGFNFTYDKRLYDRLRSGSPQSVQDHLRADIAYQQRSARFLENHDEPRSAAAFGPEKLHAAATLVATLPGMRFYHQGQFEGKKIHLPIQLGRAADEPPDASAQELYSALLEITNEKAFHAGEWRLLEALPAGDASYRNLIAYQWRDGGALKIIAVNLAASPSAANIMLGESVTPSRSYAFYDQLNRKTYVWRGQDLARTGLFVRLESFRSHIFDVTGE